MKAAELFVRCLEEEGVEYVFALPGEENLDLLDALRTSSVELVVTRHEQHAAFMAATYGRLTGRAGVCLATLGPGATNLLTGIAHAQLGGMPLVAITGQKPLHDNEEGQFQLVDVVATFRPLTKWNISIADGGSIPHSVRHAFKTAEAERPGAVHLELAEDVAREVVADQAPQRRREPRRPVPDAEAVRAAAEIIRSAKRPLLLVSAGANRKRVGRQLLRFVERTGIYVITTQLGKGVFPDDNPRSLFTLGMHQRDYVHAAIDAADLVITLGYDLTEFPPAVWNQDGSTRILHLDFSNADPDRFYQPELEVVGDIAQALEWIGAELGDGEIDRGCDRFARLRAFLDAELHHKDWPVACPVKPQRLVQEVRAALDREDILSLDNGIYKIWFARMYPAYSENTVLLDNALATMGAGLGAAMAAKMVHPQRRVLAVCGDGGFLMNGQDLETAVRLGLDLVVVIARDDGYGFIRWKQEQLGMEDYGMSFGNPDFVRYAEAFGAKGLRFSPGEDLGELIERAFALGGPVLLDCPIDYGENERLGRELTVEAERICNLEDDDS